MLKIIRYTQRNQVSTYFDTIVNQDYCWIVSDLRTKFELQQKILSTSGYFCDDKVLRASDLWRLLLKRLDPFIHEVSDAFLKTIIKDVIEKNKSTLEINTSSLETQSAYCHILISIFLHPEGLDRLNEWFEQFPDSAQKWQMWALRSRLIIHKIVNEKNMLATKWIPAYLQKFNNIEIFWKKNLIVDLSSEITNVEAELLRAISRSCDVIVLMPQPAWKNEYEYLLRPYENLQAEAQASEDLPAPNVQPGQVSVLRYSGMLAEVKACTAQVRQWLEQGVLAHEICLIAPDIEAYWPVLESYLSSEGILFKKDVKCKFQQLPDIAVWIAKLRNQTKLNSADIEMTFFKSEHTQKLRYEEFKALYAHLYDDENLSRNQWVEKVISVNRMNISKPLNRDDFVTKCLLEWAGFDIEIVKIVLQEILKNTQEHLTLDWNFWLEYLENIISGKEYTVQDADENGIHITKIMSAGSADFKYRIFLGLCDEAFTQKSRAQIPGEDINRLALDIGFYLDNPDVSDLEFELRFISEMQSSEDLYFYPGSDFQGKLLTPAKTWIDFKSKHGGLENLEQISIPAHARWDEIQQSEIEISKKLRQDLGLEPLDALQLSTLPTISASAIEDYIKCPFVFAAKRLFRLKDLPEIDIDVDHRVRGQLAHALFEKLTVEPMRFDWTDEEIMSILEVAKQDKKMIFTDEQFWQSFKKKHLSIARRFLQFEKNWREEYPATKTLYREKNFEFYFNIHTGEIKKEKDNQYFRFSGQIDRIDGSQNKWVVIDYKSSSSAVSSPATWIHNGHIQMLLYMWAIEKELVLDTQGEVIGLFYYVFKNFDRTKGFALHEQAGALYPPPKSKRSSYDQDFKKQILTEFVELLNLNLQKIAQGQIEPLPKDKKVCKSCEWNKLCRAPHLN